MTDIIGSIAIPTTTPAVGIVAGFPELGYIAEFCKSVLNVDALAHWHAVAPDTLPVLSAFTHDPKLLLDDSKLPSIYCFGVESEGNYTGTDITTLTTSVSVWWLMEPCQDEQATLRDPCRILMARVLDNALSGGRNPAWIVPGDTDPYASDWGSSLTGYIGAWKKIQVSKFSMLSVELPIIDGRGKTNPLLGIAGKITYEALLKRTATSVPATIAPPLLIATTGQTPYTVDGRNEMPEFSE